MRALERGRVRGGHQLQRERRRALYNVLSVQRRERGCDNAVHGRLGHSVRLRSGLLARGRRVFGDALRPRHVVECVRGSPVCAMLCVFGVEKDRRNGVLGEL